MVFWGPNSINSVYGPSGSFCPKAMATSKRDGSVKEAVAKGHLSALGGGLNWCLLRVAEGLNFGLYKGVCGGK